MYRKIFRRQTEFSLYHLLLLTDNYQKSNRVFVILPFHLSWRNIKTAKLSLHFPPFKFLPLWPVWFLEGVIRPNSIRRQPQQYYTFDVSLLKIRCSNSLPLSVYHFLKPKILHDCRRKIEIFLTLPLVFYFFPENTRIKKLQGISSYPSIIRQICQTTVHAFLTM